MDDKTLTAVPVDGRRLAGIRPSARQLAWQQLEFYGFVHFGVTTMTDHEWGLGHEDPALFDPPEVDADQWVRALARAGMRAVILTAKHHDGFCLWPSAVTRHSVASSPWRNGRGDLVREVSEAAARHGLKFGVYLSPWDRTEPTYGSGKDYDDFYLAQLTELLTGYGPVFCVWLDGANGEGPNGRRQTYDWDRYYARVRELQPEAVISVCGPDVRWCGNEAGHTRPDEWSVVPRVLQDAERVSARSQQADDGTFARRVRSDEDDLGSREALAAYPDDLVWYPAEVNTSIRPGWFHHPAENGQVRSVDELFGIYLSSVGGNATFLLNVPPARDGRIHPNDVATLESLGRRIDDFHSRSVPVARSDENDFIVLDLGEHREVEAVVLGEDITQGQRVERVLVEGRRGGEWIVLGETGAVGYRRIVTFAAVTVDRVRITVTEARDTPVLSQTSVIGSGTARTGTRR
ncbi:alpha-L-fucosidase [Kineosporia sp. J2-2]|uniref:alpha-L-fucosidase n=1 Tax=Kineosporia corallincola TaxID=2835133 RepID=A0ABS5TDY3_9ACTN|nr:alpha-L-fucosidase [Kineosporia corallincola]MBT0768629.1 alpha-L-fucosidase [Kineosporia corallincola]